MEYREEYIAFPKRLWFIASCTMNEVKYINTNFKDDGSGLEFMTLDEFEGESTCKV